ncbi:MAG: hypothetical protein AAGM22_23055 [Acidobacteriota bacterium]
MTQRYSQRKTPQTTAEIPAGRRRRRPAPGRPGVASALLTAAMWACSVGAPQLHAACVENPNPPVLATIIPPCDGDGILGDNLCANDFGQHVMTRPDVATDPTAEVNDQLVVFLTGAGGEPAKSQNLLFTAGHYGFRSLGVAYDTGGLASQLQNICQALTTEPAAQDCYAEGRHRAAFGITGVHTTAPPVGLYTTTIHDTVEVRLRRLLVQLAAQDTDGAWDDFLDAGSCTSLIPEGEAVAECEDDVLWHKIIIVGWSGGAGIAQHIGREHQLHGVIMLDGVADAYSPAGGTDIAALTQGLTGDDVWAVVHDQNNVAGGRPGFMRDQWDALGIPDLGVGTELQLDATTCGGDSQKGTRVDNHRFFVDNPCFANNVHASVVVDNKMLVDNQLCGACTTAAANSPTTNYMLHNAYAHILCRAEKCGGGGICP